LAIAWKSGIRSTSTHPHARYRRAKSGNCGT
jgi:hypothetical protein